MTTIKDNAGRPLYHYKHDGTYWDLNGKQITELDAMGLTYMERIHGTYKDLNGNEVTEVPSPRQWAKHTPILIPYIALWLLALGLYLILLQG